MNMEGPFSGWTTSDGEKQVQKNEFLRGLAGGEKYITVSKMLPRRWITYSSTRDHVVRQNQKKGTVTTPHNHRTVLLTYII